MSDEKKIPGQEEDKLHVEQPMTKQQKQKKSEKSVVHYVTALFAVAFVLLLLTFGMELRQHKQIVSQNQEQIEDLNEKSSSAVQKLNDIVAENEKLKDQLDDLKTAEHDNEMLRQQNEAEQKGLDAMDWFWQINEAYVKGRNQLARDLIHQMEETGLQMYLPKESITANNRFSPYDRYVEIREQLF